MLVTNNTTSADNDSDQTVLQTSRRKMLLSDALSTDDESEQTDSILARARFHRILAKSVNKKLRKERQERVEKKLNENELRVERREQVKQKLAENDEAIEERKEVRGMKEKVKGKKGKEEGKVETKTKTKKKKKSSKRSKSKKEKKEAREEDDIKRWFSNGYADFHLKQAANKKKKGSKKKKKSEKKKKVKKSQSLRNLNDISKAKKSKKDPALEAAKAEIEAAEGSYNELDLTETTANSSLASFQQWSISFPAAIDEASELTITDHNRISWKEVCNHDVSPRRPMRNVVTKPRSLPVLPTYESDDSSNSSESVFDECSYNDEDSQSDKMLDDLSDILECSERYVLLKKRPTRWDSTYSLGSSTRDLEFGGPLKSPKRTVSRSPTRSYFSRKSIRENDEEKRQVVRKEGNVSMNGYIEKGGQQECAIVHANSPKEMDPEKSKLSRDRSMRIGMDGSYQMSTSKHRRVSFSKVVEICKSPVLTA